MFQGSILPASSNISSAGSVLDCEGGDAVLISNISTSLPFSTAKHPTRLEYA